MTMKIAVSVGTDQGLDAPISPHFGRCPYFAVVEVEGQDILSVETVANPFILITSRDRCLVYPQPERERDAQWGHGGRAVDFFRQYGIEPATGAGRHGPRRHRAVS